MSLETGFKNGIIKALQNMKSDTSQYSEYKEGFWTWDRKHKVLRLVKVVQNGSPDRWQCYICDGEDSLPADFYQFLDWNDDFYSVINGILEYIDKELE